MWNSKPSIVSCTYTVTSGGNPSPSGTMTLSACNPSISNEDTLGGWDVIGIVFVVVFLGLAGQWVMGHLDRKALHTLREDLGHVIKTHPDA